MKINLSAGHTLTSGTVGILKESEETRKVVAEMKRMLTAMGHKVYECTMDKGTPTKALNDVIKMCNKTDAELSVQIHFNTCVKDYSGDGKSTGVEVFAYSEKSKGFEVAQKIAAAVSELGLKNRGAKVQKFAFVKSTKSPAVLVECCFLDDKDDVALYNPTTMARKIVKGITGVEYRG